jgi:uncharacterized membrane protein
VISVGQSDTAPFKQIQIQPFVDFSSLDAGDGIDHEEAEPESAVMAADIAKAGALLFFAVVLQLSIMAQVTILGGHPNLLLVALVCVALLRGAVFGAVAGFSAGLLADSGVSGHSASSRCC